MCWCVAYVTRMCTARMHRRIRWHTRSRIYTPVTYTRPRIEHGPVCASRYSQRGPWGNRGMGWDKGVKIIARSSLEADRWLLHSPLHLLPSTSLSVPVPFPLPPDDYPIPPTPLTPPPPPARTFTDPWDSLTGQTKNGRFEAHPPLPRLTSGV